jgi:REP element-mobilizing transposase RayT
MRQTNFNFIKDYKKEFGGSLLTGKRKSKRPLTTKSPIHLILKTDGRKLLSPKVKTLEKIVRNECHKRKIRIYDLSLNWNHMHMLIQLSDKQSYIGFIRNITSKMVLFLGGGAKGLFRFRPYTKIISWGKQFDQTYRYQKLNKLEAHWGTKARDELSRTGVFILGFETKVFIVRIRNGSIYSENSKLRC